MASLKSALLGSWIGDQILKSANVVGAVNAGNDFRHITVHVPDLRDWHVQPGDKVQLFIPGFGTRTYSPFALQEDAGTFELLAYLHGKGPGSDWARNLQVDTPLRLFGARRSLPFASMQTPIALFGDETSLGVGRSLLDAHGATASVFFEVSNLEHARPAAESLGLPADSLVARRPNGESLEEIANRLIAAATPSGTIVMSGSAQSIQLLQVVLKKKVASCAKKIKAYWSTGKTGLD